jgi:hypothetical protein
MARVESRLCTVRRGLTSLRVKSLVPTTPVVTSATGDRFRYGLDPRRGRWIRAGLSVVAAVLLCRFVAYPKSGSLDVRTDIIGYPVFHAWDYTWYQSIFRRWAFIFPALALGLHLLLGRLPAFAASRTATSFGTSHASAQPAGVENGLSNFQRFSVYARSALTGLALGLQSAMVVSRVSVAVVVPFVVVAVCGAIAIAAHVLNRSTSVQWTSLECFAVVSAVAAVVPVLGLYAVSRSTELLIASTGEYVKYEWLPAVICLVFAACAAVFFWTVLNRLRLPNSTARVLSLERSSVLYLAGGALIFLFTAYLPGTVGALDAFHEGESLGTVTSLRFHEWPWRDSLGIHGLLGDYAEPLVGIQTFGDSRWAVVAGRSMLLYPLTWVLFWWLWVRFSGRAWPVLVVAGWLVAMGSRFDWLPTSLLGTPFIRFGLMPVVLLMFVTCLARQSRRWAGATGAAIAVLVLLTPELGFLGAVIGLTLLLCEWTGRRPGEPARASFVLTTWTTIGLLAVMIPFLAVLVGFGVLDDYLDYFLTFARDHALTGARPVLWWAPGVDLFWVVFPPAVSLGFVVWVLARPRTSRRRPEDWAMFALATFNLVYFQAKFLNRPDAGHLKQYAGVSASLVVYVVSRLAVGGWDAVGSVLRGRWAAVRNVALGFALVAGVFVVKPPGPTVRALPTRIRPAAAEPASVPKLGYAVDPAADRYLLEDVGSLFAAADLGVQDVFDFSNSPAVFYYLLPYESPTRYLHVSMAIRGRSQDQLIAELAASPPAVVVFDSSKLGLTIWDDVANQVRHDDVSAWVLNNYRPWVSAHGYTFLQRNDLTLPVPAAFGPEPGREVHTGALLLGVQRCSWGMAPSYLDWELPAAPATPLTGEAVTTLVTVSGWLIERPGDPPPTELSVVTRNGTSLALVALVADRPDVATATGSENPGSGFQLTVGLIDGEDPLDLRLAITDSTGNTTLTAPLTTTTREVDRYLHHIEELTTSEATGQPLRRVRIQRSGPEETDWLVLDSGASTPEIGDYQIAGMPSLSLEPGSSYGPSADPAQLITFQTNETSPSVQGIRLDSCAQWHGFGSTVYVSAPSEEALNQLSLRTATTADD